MNNKSMIILSGGLDSAVSLALENLKSKVDLALFFDYGQKAFVNEKIAAEKLCDFYDVKLNIIELPWLKNISSNALTSEAADIPAIDENKLDNLEISLKSKESVWIPNRNGLFLNIAGSFADSLGYKKIIIGANKEEASTFLDNSKDFINAINNEFNYSTQVMPQVVAPLINKNKQEIIEIAKDINFPFNLIWSCYSAGQKHCGKCESCKRLKRGLERVGLFDIVNLLFDIN